jgi:hypothetical protein
MKPPDMIIAGSTRSLASSVSSVTQMSISRCAGTINIADDNNNINSVVPQTTTIGSCRANNKNSITQTTIGSGSANNNNNPYDAAEESAHSCVGTLLAQSELTLR